MPAWGDILREVGEENRAGKSGHDAVRRKYLALLAAHTGRPVLLYASAFTTSREIPPGLLQINLEDKHGLMTAVKGIKGGPVDLVLHSPGGQIDATEAIVGYLRSVFTEIRVIVPLAAMSAATMIVCACDELVMGSHSQLGPTDPQIPIPTAHGFVPTPARAIVQQFGQAKSEIAAQPKLLPAWAPIIQTFAPAAPVLAGQAEVRAGGLVREWLTKYLMASAKAESVELVAAYLTDFEKHGSHGRPVLPAMLNEIKMPYTPLEKDPVLQDLALSVFHATAITFDQTHSVKVIENSDGIAYLKFHRTGPFPPSTPSPEEPNTPESPPPPAIEPNRQQRRAQQAIERKRH